MIVTLVTGLMASVAHVVTGPDHLAAVTPLAIEQRKKSWVIGLLWGLGHTLGMLLIGGLFLLFRELLPVEYVSRNSEFIIGLLLILIGGLAIGRTFIRHRHHVRAHPHVHTNPFVFAHIHKHDHAHRSDHKHTHHEVPRQQSALALGVGVVHGFAGFSHLFALLPSLAFPSLGETVLYLLTFAFGTILTMVLYSILMGLVAHRTFMSESPGFNRWLTYSGGFLAIAVGIWWLINPF
jgi:ABC-type nickel/cobalt efflux system permease component RcnA